MKAWRFREFGNLQLEDIPMPEVEPGWVVVKVKVVQPAVTDVGLVDGYPHMFYPRFKRMMRAGKSIRIGHEFCGEVVEVGKGVETLKLGDRVAAPSASPCGRCALCRNGQQASCESPVNFGVEIAGAFAEYTCAPELALVSMPEELTDHEISALQPMISAIGAVHSAQTQLNDTVVVIGCGACGLASLQMQKLSGAGKLLGIDPRPEALDMARQYGATEVINPKETDPVQGVLDLTGGMGVAIVHDCAGGDPRYELAGFDALHWGFQMIARGGKVIEESNLPGKVELDTIDLRIRGAQYISGSRGGPDARDAMRLMAFLVATRRVQVAPQISHILQGLETLPQALEIAGNKSRHRATNSPQIVVSG
ncbi:MAG: zinc-binding dehydrogenase [Dehalococcoidia bacterium]